MVLFLILLYHSILTFTYIFFCIFLKHYQGKYIKHSQFTSSFHSNSHPLPELLALSAEQKCQDAYLISSPLEWSGGGKGGRLGGGGSCRLYWLCWGWKLFLFFPSACLACLCTFNNAFPVKTAVVVVAVVCSVFNPLYLEGSESKHNGWPSFLIICCREALYTDQPQYWNRFLVWMLWPTTLAQG